MANDEHLAILRQGGAVWNAWRSEHPDVRPDLSEADLMGMDLRRVDLSGANLGEAGLMGADLSGARLSGARLSRAVLYRTVFAAIDLSTVIGLDTVLHRGPSEISISVLYQSHGKIPEAFLRGCGVPDPHIEYLPALIGAMQPIQYYSCFISYSSKDEDFARRLHERMRAEHLRVWFAPEDIRGGKSCTSKSTRPSASTTS